MGLDTTHDCWHGPYSSFNRFRHQLAEQIGINLDEYAGYSDKEGGKNLADIPHKIMPLLNHSDCDGRLTVKEAKSIAEGLEEILEKVTDTNSMNVDALGFAAQIERFINGCKDAVSKKEMIKFG